MKDQKKTLALIFALLMLSQASACSQNNPESGNANDAVSDTKETESETEAGGDLAEQAESENERILPDIPDSADYGDDEILFLVWDYEPYGQTVRRYRDIYSEGVVGEGINDAVYNRNSRIEAVYKVKIAQERMNTDNIAGNLAASVKSGETVYDVVYPQLEKVGPIFKQGLVHNLLNIRYIDLSKPWWDPDSVESFTINGYLPCVATSLNVNDKDATAAIAFNKEMAQSHNLEDLYQTAREGKWTIDKVAELSDIAMRDLDGNGKITVDDIYGFLGGKDVMESFYYGSGGMMITKNDSGELEFSFGTERDLDVTTKIIEFMNQPWFMNHHNLKNQDDNYYRSIFETGHGLFFWMRLDDVTNMRASDTDFGILPIPKYEETQQDYHSHVSRWTTGIPSVPVTLTDEKLDEVGLILEALSADSHYTLIPEYIETSLKTKNSRDAESKEMLEIILQHRVYDPMHVYDFGGFSSSYIDLGQKADTNVSSFLKTRKKLVEKMMKKDIEKFAEYSGN